MTSHWKKQEKQSAEPADIHSTAEIVQQSNDHNTEVPAKQPCDDAKTEKANQKLKANQLVKEKSKCLDLIMEERDVYNFNTMLETFLTKYKDSCPGLYEYFKT